MSAAGLENGISRGHALGLSIRWRLCEGRSTPVGAVWAGDAGAVRRWAREQPWSVHALVERALDELPCAPKVGDAVGVGLACILWSRIHADLRRFRGEARRVD